MYNILRIVILVVSYYVLRCMYCILCYLIIKLTCSIEEPLCGNAIKSLLLLLLFIIIHGDFFLPIRFFSKGACLSRICVKLVSHMDHITLRSSDELISFQSISFNSFKNSLSLKCLKCRLRVNEFANCLCQVDLLIKYISE